MDMAHTDTATPEASNKADASFPVSPLMGVLVVVGIYLAAGQLGKLIFDIVTPVTHLGNSSYVQFAYTLTVEALTLGLLVLFMRSNKASHASIGLIKPRMYNILAFLAGTASYYVLTSVVILLAIALFHLDKGQHQQLGFDKPDSILAYVVTFVSLVILPPLVEEIVMRGFLFSSLKRGMSVVKAALLTSLLFAIAHLQLGSGAPPLWTAAIDTFVLSLVLCALRQKTGNLWAGIGVHMLKNCFAFYALFVVSHS